MFIRSFPFQLPVGTNQQWPGPDRRQQVQIQRRRPSCHWIASTKWGWPLLAGFLRRIGSSSFRPPTQIEMKKGRMPKNFVSKRFTRHSTVPDHIRVLSPAIRNGAIDTKHGVPCRGSWWGNQRFLFFAVAQAPDERVLVWRRLEKRPRTWWSSSTPATNNAIWFRLRLFAVFRRSGCGQFESSRSFLQGGWEEIITDAWPDKRSWITIISCRARCCSVLVGTVRLGTYVQYVSIWVVYCMNCTYGYLPGTRSR